MKRVTVQSEVFEPEQVLADFRGQIDECGGVSSFVGYVRGEAGGVSELFLEHYPGFTEAQIEQIVEAALNRFDVTAVKVIHRHGAMFPGEPIVLVAAAAAHRKPAMLAVDFLMDYLKTDAPFWKRETGPEGSSWIEPRGADHSARRQWDDKEQG